MSAVAAAVEDATGLRVRALPISPPRVFAAMQEARNEAAANNEEQA
jgi:CO/xanthine dehydrogenase Mo-binding subunit